jgi:hypothetical protein
LDLADDEIIAAGSAHGLFDPLTHGIGRDDDAIAGAGTAMERRDASSACAAK